MHKLYNDIRAGFKIYNKVFFIVTVAVGGGLSIYIYTKNEEREEKRTKKDEERRKQKNKEMERMKKRQESYQHLTVKVIFRRICRPL